MNNTTHHFADEIKSLETVLSQQHIYLLKMLAILRQEHQALGSGNLEQFEEIVQRKHQQVRKLEEIQPLLNTVEKMVGGVLSKSTFSVFIQRMQNSKEKSDLMMLWEKFHNTLEECNLQNKTNNRVLNASALNAKQALNILHGNTGKVTPNIYSKSGLQQDRIEGQSIAIA